MKKQIAALIAACCLVAMTTLSVNAQGLYVQLKGGLSFPSATDDLGSSNPAVGTSDLNQASGDNYTNSALYGSYGAGTNFGLGVGYMFSEYFGFELNGYFFSGKEVLDGRLMRTTDILGATTTETGEQYSSSSQIRLAPSLVVNAPVGGLAPYARFGVLLPVSGKTISRANVNTINDAFGVTTTIADVQAELETKGQLSLGFESAFGVNVSPLGGALSFFAEVHHTALTIKAKSTTYTMYEFTSDILPDQSLSDRTVADNETIYVDQLTPSSNTTTNANFSADQPTEALAPKGNYNSFGINVGIRFTLGQ